MWSRWAVWFNVYPGTREGVILVVTTPPIEVPAPGAAPRGSAPADSGQESRAGGSPTNGERRRAELADFLRKRRASLSPAEVGLPDGGRRRTPGLRREEVALLAGVGTTWYTWLEQGRDVRASMEVLEAISTALRMTPAERTHLVLLGRGEEPPPCKLAAEQVSPTVRRLVENLGPNPAYILGRRWDYLAWNQAACALFGDFGAMPAHTRNHLWLMFMDPLRREMFEDWEETSRLAVAKFRADSARNIGDPAFEELEQALRKSSREFCQAWKRHEVARQGEGRKHIRHPIAGSMVFEHAVFHPAEASEQRLILYSPVPETGTAAKLAKLIEAKATRDSSARADHDVAGNGAVTGRA